MISFFSIATSDLDFGWMKQAMMKGMKLKSRRIDLEKQYGYRLVFEKRDWPVGKVRPDCVTDSIEQSRKVIIIVSR